MPEGGAFRGMMSNGVRLVLTPADSTGAAALPRSVFYKRVVMDELEAAHLKARGRPRGRLATAVWPPCDRRVAATEPPQKRRVTATQPPRNGHDTALSRPLLQAATAPAKLARDVHSFAVEAGFLGSAGCARLASRGGMHLPRAYHVEQAGRHVAGEQGAGSRGAGRGGWGAPAARLPRRAGGPPCIAIAVKATAV